MLVHEPLDRSVRPGNEEGSLGPSDGFRRRGYVVYVGERMVSLGNGVTALPLGSL
jgi:hypothetical protein